jgi:predicted DNA binding CopG/RHH family protein
MARMKMTARAMTRKVDPTKIHFDENTVIEDADLDKEEFYVEGERLTEERAEKLAAEVLAKARAMNLRPGGKSLSGGRKHSPVVQVRLSEHTRDKLRAIAKARGMSVSKLSRRVLDEFVDRETAG